MPTCLSYSMIWFFISVSFCAISIDSVSCFIRFSPIWSTIVFLSSTSSLAFYSSFSKLTISSFFWSITSSDLNFSSWSWFFSLVNVDISSFSYFDYCSYNEISSVVCALCSLLYYESCFLISVNAVSCTSNLRFWLSISSAYLIYSDSNLSLKTSNSSYLSFVC